MTLWPYPVVKYLRGEIDEKALINLATDNDKMIDARGYLGYDLLLKGKPAEAREHFLWTKDHGYRNDVTSALAIAELDRPKSGGHCPPGRAGAGEHGRSIRHRPPA